MGAHSFRIEEFMFDAFHRLGMSVFVRVSDRSIYYGQRLLANDAHISKVTREALVMEGVHLVVVVVTSFICNMVPTFCGCCRPFLATQHLDTKTLLTLGVDLSIAVQAYKAMGMKME